MIRTTLQVTSLAAALALVVAAPAAAQLRGTAAALTGSRTEANGLVTAGNYAGGSTQMFGWAVETNFEGNPALFRYTYTFTNFASPAISHFILGLTNDCTLSSGCVTDPTLNGSNITLLSINTWTEGSGNPLFPGAPAQIFGVKFDIGAEPNANGETIYQFTSNRSPVWGDFYTKAGSCNNANSPCGVAYNAGLVTGSDQTNVLNFVARPNGTYTPDTTVPEPSTYALLATGLAGLGVAARRRRK